MKPLHFRGKPYHLSFPQALTIIFLLMALLSAAGLDYINWTQGKKSYLFPNHPKPELAPASKALGDIIQSQLTSLSITPESLKQFWDSDRNHHIMIELSEKDYTRIKAPLAISMKANKAAIQKEEEYWNEGKRYHLWKVRGEKGEKLSLLFSCRAQEASPSTNAPKKNPQPQVALILDDMGYSLTAINSICRIGFPLTISIIPFTPLARETAEIAHKNGLEVILHVPLESMNNTRANTMDGMILSGMTEQKVDRIMDSEIQNIPYVCGVNNHMGSKATKNRALMRILMERIKAKHLYFIDSLTTGESVAYATAKSLGIPAAKRNVFLDDELNEDYIKGQLDELFRMAKKSGTAVGIGHPSGLTLRVLNENLETLQKQYHTRMVFASQIVK